MDQPSKGIYKHSFWWNIAFSAYWFSQSYKWFVILLILLPGQVKDLVPGDQKNGTWGFVASLGATLAIILPPLFGRINETWRGRWGYRQLWIGGGAVVTLGGCAVLGTAHSMFALIIGYLMLQFGDQVSTGPYAGMIPDVVPSGELDYASGILGALRLFGQIVSALLAIGLLMAHRTFSDIYFGIALCTFLCTAATLWVIRKAPPLARSAAHRGNFIQDWIEPFKHHDFKFVWLNRFVVSLAMALVLTYAVYYLTDAFSSYVLFGFVLGTGVQGAQYGALVLAVTVALFGGVGAISTPKLSAKYGRKKLLNWAGYLCCVMLFPCAFVRDFSLLWLFTSALSLGNGVYQAADWALVSDVLPDKERAGTHMGIWHAADTVTQMSAGFLGVMIDLGNRFGVRYLGQKWVGYVSLILIGSVLFLLSTVFVRHIKKST